MLSLKPRFDLFKFNFPKDAFSKELLEKYNEILYQNSGVVSNIIDYINESVVGVSIPGITMEPLSQSHHESNTIKRTDNRINVEPRHEYSYSGVQNPLEMIDKEFKVTMRMNQGLYNYFFIYENFFHAVCRTTNNQPIDQFIVEILDETGKINAQIKLYNLIYTSVEGLEFTFNQLERESHNFDVTFRFNNIDFDFIPRELR